MTTLNNDELRKAIRLYLAGLSSSGDNFRTSDQEPAVAKEVIDAYEDSFVRLIATHDQQLLEAILEGEIYTGDPNGVHRDARGQVSAINLMETVSVEHIKSVFQKEGE